MMPRTVDNFEALKSLLETRQKECPECGGEGQVEIDVPRPASFGRDIGELYAEWLACERCSGKGEIKIEE
tara:strand:+ start:693 stop:902 length:210 start_codon:yes stop_codon:yes gene_type:complete